MNIYVGNISNELAEEELKQSFTEFGEVASVNIIKDKFTNQSRGFGFIEMPTENEAEAAIEALNGTELKGRTLTVNKARPKPDYQSGRNRNQRDDRKRHSGGGGGRRY